MPPRFIPQTEEPEEAKPPEAESVLAVPSPAKPVEEQTLADIPGDAPIENYTLTCWNGEKFLSWYQWKAEMLNQLFAEQGRTGRPGHITGVTVKDGENKARSK
jgi:hypothetical protein